MCGIPYGSRRISTLSSRPETSIVPSISGKAAAKSGSCMSVFVANLYCAITWELSTSDTHSASFVEQMPRWDRVPSQLIDAA